MSRDAIITRMPVGVNVRISTVTRANATCDESNCPDALAPYIEGDEVARLDLTANADKPMVWDADGELELPADLGEIEIRLLCEGPASEGSTGIGTVLLTGYDLLVSVPDDSGGPVGKITFDVCDSSYRLVWDCVPFCEEASMPEDATTVELHELGKLSKQVTALRDQLYKRYLESGDVADIEKAIKVAETVCRLGSKQENVFPFSLHNLGVIPDNMLESALKWARSSMEDPMLLQSSFEAYDYAINLIPQVVWQGLPLSKRYSRIKVIGDLANEAVTVALANQQCSKALDWLERAQSILWGQLLRVQPPVETLENINASLGT
ncbi:hypothetical protein FOMPIDRAFT_1054439 [Fomitopsis schrenkii]|uniref:Uncharacterized protein n=1 Tax=Fomitopsis schrenkii TaxID=2126942 RepID=S8EZS2_FOMSC|nr:hypothetical protein FOMPIDRAFT_1054439 [Fomitopsis schrenkii]